MLKEIWYVEFPTYKYKEDVKELAQRNNLKIIDATFQGKNKQCEKAPKLTLKVKPEKVDNKEPEKVDNKEPEKEPLKEENQGE